MRSEITWASAEQGIFNSNLSEKNDSAISSIDRLRVMCDGPGDSLLMHAGLASAGPIGPTSVRHGRHERRPPVVALWCGNQPRRLHMADYEARHVIPIRAVVNLAQGSGHDRAMRGIDLHT